MQSYAAVFKKSAALCFSLPKCVKGHSLQSNELRAMLCFRPQTYELDVKRRRRRTGEKNKKARSLERAFGFGG